MQKRMQMHISIPISQTCRSSMEQWKVPLLAVPGEVRAVPAEVL
jgi:hypothetical protein